MPTAKKPKPHRRGPGHRFGPGNNANPKGRPRKTDEQRALEAQKVDAAEYAKQYTKEAIDKLVAIMRGDQIKTGVGQPVLARASIGYQKEAALELLDRGWGSPAQAVSVKSEEVVLHVVRTDLVEEIEGRMSGIQERLADQASASSDLH